MAVTIEIKSDELLKKNISVLEIARLQNLSYGILDDNYCLIRNKVGKYTILYDDKCIGRGIEVSIEKSSIFLRIPLPTIVREIELLYSLIEGICKKFKIKDFYCDDERMTIDYAYHFIEKYKEISLNAILDIDNKIMVGEVEQFFIFGALNPIALGKNEMNEINRSLEGLEKVLDRLQRLDVYYASSAFYRRNDGSLFGVYFVDENIDMVIPIKPYVLFSLKEEISSWYVMFPGDVSLLYEDFIKNVEGEYYDNNHVIVSIDYDNMRKLTSLYSVDMITNERRENTYWGISLDNGFNHVNKIKNMELEIDELAGFNHLAIYLRWCMEHELLSKEVLEGIPELIEDDIDLREVIRDNKVFNGCLKLGHFNEMGRAFSKEYYVFNKEDSSFYPSCVDLYALDYFGSEKYNCKEFKDEAYLFVKYDEDYYLGLAKYIDRVWDSFVKNK